MSGLPVMEVGDGEQGTRVRGRIALAGQLAVWHIYIIMQPTIEKPAATIDKAREAATLEDAIAQRIAELKKWIEQLNVQSNLKGGIEVYETPR